MTTIIRDIPLNKLVPSDKNVRRTCRDSGIAELAASVLAHGLLQSLSVRTVVDADGTETGTYEVLGGSRRLAALKLLVKQKKLKKSAPVPCVIADEGEAEEVSLAENVMREALHPADQFEAFHRLHHEHGIGIEEIGARFGVTPAVVKQRLRLGAASPKLLALYREGKLNLDQLMAFCLTDDHVRQEQLFEGLSWNTSPHTIRSMLTEQQIKGHDRRAVFVGAEGYEAAGGVILRDLFAEDGGGYFTEPALLNRLAVEKLAAAADEIRSEGWKWVEPVLDFPHGHGFRQVYPRQKFLTPKEAKRIAQAEAELEKLAAEYEEADELPQEVSDRLDQLTAEIDATSEFDPDEVARGGVFVSIAHDGTLKVVRAFVRPEDEPVREKCSPDGGDAAAQTANETEGDGAKPLSSALMLDLTANRTAALRDALAARPDVAVLAVVHVLAMSVFYPYSSASCLKVRATVSPLTTYAPGIEDSMASARNAQRHAQWAQRMPQEPGDLWGLILALDFAGRWELMAHCAASTVDAVTARADRGSAALSHADQLAAAVSLDMADYWTPTVDNYLGRVSKAHIMSAVEEGASSEAAQKMVDMKKHAMAETAEQVLTGRRWLPEALRSEPVDQPQPSCGIPPWEEAQAA